MKFLTIYNNQSIHYHSTNIHTIIPFYKYYIPSPNTAIYTLIIASPNTTITPSFITSTNTIINSIFEHNINHEMCKFFNINEPINIIANNSTSSIKFLISIIINGNNNNNDNNIFYMYSGNTLSCISPS